MGESDHCYFFGCSSDCKWQVQNTGHRSKVQNTGLLIIERLRFSSTPNGRREFVPRDQVFPLFFVHSLLLLHKSKKFYASFNHMNRSGPFLPAYFLF